MAKAIKLFSKLPKEDKLKTALEMFDSAVTEDIDWQAKAENDFAFAAGDQWTSREKMVLEIEERPAFTWNYIKSKLDLIMGVVEQNRVRIVPQPVEPSDQILCDVIEAAADNIDDQTNAETEEDDALLDAITCGRGFVAFDISPNPRKPGWINFDESSVPVHEIRLDPAGIKDDLSDAGYIFREKWFKIEDFRTLYPEHVKDIEDLLETGERLSVDTQGAPSDAVFDTLDEDSDDSDYDTPLDSSYYSRKKRQIRVIHMEYWESFKRYYGFNPTTKKVEEFQEQDLSGLKKQIPDFEHEVLWDKKVRWIQFCKDIILFEGDNPIPYDGFSIVPVFAYKDKSKKGVKHYGVVRLLKDPQKEVNKRWSQALNLMVNQGQGIMAETDAFVDVAQAEGSWNDPRRITWMTKGAISQGKYQEKPAIQYPDASIRMEELAQEAMNRISGINPDLLGMDRGRQEAGVVIRLRQQQGLVLLAKIFRNYKEMRKQIFLRKASVIMRFMPDDQIQKIIGENDKFIIQGGMIIDQEAEKKAQMQMQQQQMQMQQAMQAQQMQQQQQQGPPGQPSGPPGQPSQQGPPQGPPGPPQGPQGPQGPPGQSQGQQGQPPGPPPVPRIPLRDIENLEYNIKVQDAPGNMTKEMLELSTYMEMMGKNFPVDPKMIIERMDITAKQKTRWLDFIDQQQAQQQQQMAQQMQMQQQAMQTQTQLEQGKLQIEQGKVQTQQQAEMGKLQIEQGKVQIQQQIDQTKLQLQGQKAKADVESARQKSALTSQRIEGDQEISEAKLVEQRRKTDQDAKLKLRELSQEERLALKELSQEERESVREAAISLAQLDADKRKTVMDMASKMAQKSASNKE